MLYLDKITSLIKEENLNSKIPYYNHKNKCLKVFVKMPKINSNNELKEKSSSRINRAKRILFYHNGNMHFNGIVVPVSAQRYRSFDSLKADLTTMLSKKVMLITAIQNVYTLDGVMVPQIDNLEDGTGYVCGVKGERFKRVDYGKGDTAKNGRFMR